MGREIRRVPANWRHPIYRTVRMRRNFHGEIETWKPLLNRSFERENAEWIAQNEAWARGERPKDFDVAKYGDISFVDWHGEQPEKEWYVPYDPASADLPWFQMYETVSEGTPVTPAFATADELVDWLVVVGEVYENGESDGSWSRERAEAFVKNEKSAPSFMVADGQIFDAKSGFPK